MAMDPVTALILADGILSLGLRIQEAANRPAMTPEEEAAYKAELEARVAETAAKVVAYQPRPLGE